MQDSSHEFSTALAFPATPESRAELAIGLEELGLHPVIVDSVEELLSAASLPRRLVVVDIDRPGLDPARLCKSLRETAGCAAAPVLLIADGHSERGDRITRAIASGASDYLWKPFNYEELARKVRKLSGATGGQNDDSVQDLREDINWRLRDGGTYDLDGFVIDGIIGRGGMGTIYRAADTAGNRTVAIKILSPSYSRNQHLLRRFLAEAEVIRQINHPHIIRFYDVRHKDDTHFAVIEQVEGGSLKEVLELEGQLDVDAALSIASCVASALAELHRHRIVHRDIKPGNILISDSGDVKLVDFGLAKSSRDKKETRSGIVLGTPRYIAPEQAREGASADIRADIYSLGITLYQMLTGTAPFIGEDTHEVLIKHLSHAATPIGERSPGIPPMVSRLVTLMIAKSPDDRFQTPNQLLEGIELARQGKDPIDAIPSDSGPLINNRTPTRRPAPPEVATEPPLVKSPARVKSKKKSS